MEIREFVQAEVIILVPVLDFVVHFLRGFVSLKKIPIIVVALGILLTGLYEFALEPVNTLSHLLLTIFSAVTQGILVAGSSLLLAKESITDKNAFESEEPGEAKGENENGDEKEKGTENVSA